MGYLVANLRGVRDARAGDTILDAANRAAELLPGLSRRQVDGRSRASTRPTPTSTRTCATRWRSCSSTTRRLHYEPETSTALGFGFRCGFLGLLHMEIVQERLEREFDLDLITTVPTVEYHVYRTDGEMLLLENPSQLPDPAEIDRIEEPYVKARIMAPADYIGGIMKLGQERRGVYNGMHYLDTAAGRVRLGVSARRDRARLLRPAQVALARLRLARLRDGGYRASDLVKLDMLINGEPIDAFSVIIHRDKAYEYGRKVAEKLKELIPRQLFQVVDPGGDRQQDHRARDDLARSARTCSPSATAATSPASASSSRSRRRGRSA